MKTANVQNYGPRFVNLNYSMKKIILLLVAAVLSACTKTEVIKVLTPDNQQMSPYQVDTNDMGTVNGGGGKGVLCVKDDKESLKVLDLYEAKQLYNLEIKEVPQNEEQAELHLANLMARHYNNVHKKSYEEYVELSKQEIRKFVNDKMKFISSDKKLNATKDSFEPLIEKNCSIVQIAVFYDESALLVDRSLWDKLDLTNKMALLAHEIFYYQGRLRGATNSVSARKLVGQLFSTQGVRPLTDGVPSDKTKVLQCGVRDKSGAGVGYAWGYDNPQTNKKSNEQIEAMEFVFTDLLKQPVLFRTSFTLIGVELEYFKTNTQVGGSSYSDFLIDSYDQSGKTVAVNYNFSSEDKNIYFRVRDDKTGEISESYKMTCILKNNEN